MSSRTPALWEMYSRNCELLRAQRRELLTQLGMCQVTLADAQGVIARQSQALDEAHERIAELELVVADYLVEQAKAWDARASAGTIALTDGEERV